ncbi:hypothetical protein PMAYCL1PPCAC_11988 [Pristionchus mayeri]|uniref:C2H2-type domain-containing protein n=1 Tax=Pristionchus mayeri TaxID=1317129 RepID=A0AAN5C8N2_9BILA|nr:hypothetical protein PMAYCL1PPCAC_11988 [Pristionchus mayeri]
MRKAKKKTRLSMECIEKNLEDIITVSLKEGVVVDPLTISSRKTVYECPYYGCSKEFEVKCLFRHLKTHKGQENCVTSCPFCERRMDSLLLIGHLENNHPELDVNGELKELHLSIDPIHKAIRDTVASERSIKRQAIADRIAAVLRHSIFEPTPSSMSLPEFRTSLRRKLIEDTKSNVNLIFKFPVRSNSLEWRCLICTDRTGLAFKNPFSLRLNALFHLETHVNDEHFDHLQTVISKEWSLIKKENTDVASS